MARCGCNTAMSTTCEAVMTCIASALGPGLDYNETTRQIELRISGDAGNVAAIGSDDGFFAPADVGPGPMTWPVTVATLPAQAISATSGSNLVGPATAPQMVEYSVANRIDMYSVSVFALADGTAFEQVGGFTTSVTAYTDNPGSMTQQHISSLTVQQLHYDAGARTNPTGRNSDAPASLLTPDGGWGGFYAPVYEPRNIAEMLRQVRGRMVVELLPQRSGMDQAQIVQGIQAAIDAVVAAGAQEWVIIQVPAQLDDNSQAPIGTWVAMVQAEGITAGVNLNAEHLMADPFTAAEITATGATWVTLLGPGHPDGRPNSRITELVTAGLEVVVVTTARQYWTTNAFSLGARAVRSSDAVYARGVRGVTGDLDYRQTLIPGLDTRTTVAGGLTVETDVETAMWNAGFARTDLPGRWFPMQYAWSGSTPVIRNAQLLGTIGPVPNATNYQLRVRMRRDADADPDNRSAGLFFAVPDDRGVSHLSGSAVNPDADGYIAAINSRTTGTRMQLQVVTNGVSTSLGSVTTGATAYPADTWVEVTITVTPTDVTFAASTNATPITAANTAFRGGYVYYVWDDQVGPMVHGYDNPVDLVTYEALA